MLRVSRVLITFIVWGINEMVVATAAILPIITDGSKFPPLKVPQIYLMPLMMRNYRYRRGWRLVKNDFHFKL